MFPDDSASKSEAEEGEQREVADEAAETTTKRKNSWQKSSHGVYWIGSKSPKLLFSSSHDDSQGVIRKCLSASRPARHSSVCNPPTTLQPSIILRLGKRELGEGLNGAVTLMPA